MAKNKPSFNVDPDEFDETRLDEPIGNTHEYTHTHTHEHKGNGVYEPTQKKNKTKRIQILTYEHLIDRMDKYADKRGVKRVAVFEAAIEDYLNRVDPEE